MVTINIADISALVSEALLLCFWINWTMWFPTEMRDHLLFRHKRTPGEIFGSCVMWFWGLAAFLAPIFTLFKLLHAENR